MKIKAQANYYETEASLELPVNVGQVHDLLIAMKTTGKMVILYNNGYVQGINLQQREKISAISDPKIKNILGLGEKKF